MWKHSQPLYEQFDAEQLQGEVAGTQQTWRAAGGVRREHTHWLLLGAAEVPFELALDLASKIDRGDE